VPIWRPKSSNTGYRGSFMGLEHTFETPDTLEPARIVATDGYHRAMRIPVYQARERFNNERNPTDHALDAVPDLETGSTHAVYPRTAPASEPWIETRTGSKGWAALCGTRAKRRSARCRTRTHPR
jgi:hypothetical protein